MTVLLIVDFRYIHIIDIRFSWLVSVVGRKSLDSLSSKQISDHWLKSFNVELKKNYGTDSSRE